VFADAGVAPVDIATHPGTARFPGLRVVLEADLRGWLPMVGVHLPEDTIRRVLEAADGDLGKHVRRTAAGIEFPLSVHVVSAAKS
jgi:hypothetical protein